jgi:hypothetical protein
MSKQSDEGPTPVDVDGGLFEGGLPRLKRSIQRRETPHGKDERRARTNVRGECQVSESATQVKGKAYRIRRRRPTRGELVCRESRLAKDREWFRELVESVRRASAKPEGVK